MHSKTLLSLTFWVYTVSCRSVNTNESGNFFCSCTKIVINSIVVHTFLRKEQNNRVTLSGSVALRILKKAELYGLQNIRTIRLFT